MRKLIFTYTLLFFGMLNSVFGQSASEFDSVLIQVKKIIQKHPDSALTLTHHLEQIIKDGNLQHKLSKLNLAKGDIYLTMREDDKALQYYLKMDDYISNDTILQTQNGRIARYYRNKGKHDKAIEYALKSLHNSEIMKDTIKITSAYGNLSSIYHRLRESAKALEYESQRIRLAKESGYIKGEFLGWYNRSQYLPKDSYEARIVFLSKADSINTNFIKNKHYTQIIKLNKGESLVKSESYNQALISLNAIKSSSLSSTNFRVKSYFLQIYTQALQGLKRYDEAKKYAELGLEISKDNESLEHQDEFYTELVFINVKQNQFEDAYYNLRSNIEVQDSIKNTEVLKEIEELNLKYEASKTEAELVQSELKVTNRTNQRNMALFGGSLLFIVAGYFWSRYRYKKRESDQLQKIQLQKIEALEKEQKILSLASMIEGQEEERKRIAQDLHDGLGGLLSSVKSHFSIIQSEIEKLESMNIYKKANNMIDEAVSEVRRISHNLMPTALRLNGLLDAVSQLLASYNQRGETTFTMEHNGRNLSEILESQSVPVFRIIQEASNNIVKHANAKNAMVQINLFENELNLIIEDDGVGFDSDQKYTGLGVGSIKSRVSHLNGTISIDSRPNEGTSISINLPLEQN